MALDSECVVAALQRRSGLLKPFFAHGAAEIEDNIREMRKLCPSVGHMLAIPGEENPVDIATRGTVDMVDISLSSTWQKGPKIAYTVREIWQKEVLCTEPVPGLEEQGQGLLCSLVSIQQSSAPHPTAAEKENYHPGLCCLASNIDTEASGRTLVECSGDSSIQRQTLSQPPTTWGRQPGRCPSAHEQWSAHARRRTTVASTQEGKEH